MRLTRSDVALSIALLMLPLLTTSCDRMAEAQSAPAKMTEVLDDPDALLSGKPASELSLNGVRLGDPVSAIPQNIIKARRDEQLECTNCTYVIVNDHVWAMTLTDHLKIAQLQLPQTDPALIQMRLGKADQIDVAEDQSKHEWKAYWFSTNRIARYAADDASAGWVSITLCQ